MTIDHPIADESSPRGASLPSDEESGAKIVEQLAAIWAHKWVILAITVVVATGMLYWSVRQPRIYEAVCSLEYDPNPVRPLGRTVEDVGDPIGSFWASQEFFETQNRIISSRTISDRVVRRLGLHADPTFFGVSASGFEPRDPERAAQLLQQRIRVEPVVDTRIVRVIVRDGSPERAQTIANAIVDAYIDKTIEDRLGSTGQALEWLGNRLQTLQSDLESSEDALHRFKLEHDVLSVSMEDRQNQLANGIQRYAERLTEARIRRIELQARVNRLRHLNRRDPMEVSGAAFAEHTSINELRGSLHTKLAERERLSVRYGEAHPDMQEADREIESLRGNLRREIGTAIDTAESELAEVQQVESGLNSALEEANQAGHDLNQREIEYERLNRQRENTAKIYGHVLERTTETNLTRMLRTTHARVVDRALVPSFPVSPNNTKNGIIGLIAGLLLGVFLALGLSRLDRRIKNVEQVEALGLPVIGILPSIDARTKTGGRELPVENRDLISHTHPMSAAAECCRTIRTNLTFMSAADPVRTYVVTSANPQEGKTTVGANIAISLAQSGKRVLLIDTDLRRPRVHKAFGLDSGVGATSVLVRESSLEEAAQATEIPGLHVLPCGPVPPNPSELLHGAGFEALLARASELYDRVIFDSPPLGAVTDAAVLAPQLGGVILVLRAGRTTRDALRSARRQLRDVSANILGTVVNDVDLSARRYGYGGYSQYYRQYGYYGSPEPTDRDEGSVEDAAE